MLQISRREGEAVAIGDDIIVTVLARRKGEVLLGIDAPRGLPILRGELLVPPVPAAPGDAK